MNFSFLEAGFDSLLSLGKDVGNRIRCMSSKKVDEVIWISPRFAGVLQRSVACKTFHQGSWGLSTQQAGRCIVQAFGEGAFRM